MKPVLFWKQLNAFNWSVKYSLISSHNLQERFLIEIKEFIFPTTGISLREQMSFQLLGSKLRAES